MSETCRKCGAEGLRGVRGERWALYECSKCGRGWIAGELRPGHRRLQLTVADMDSGETLFEADAENMRVGEWDGIREKCGAFAEVLTEFAGFAKALADGGGKVTE